MNIENTIKYLTNIIDELKKENATEKLRLSDVISRFDNDNFVENVCLSYRHDFGLMAEQDKQRLRFECREWMRAIVNNWQQND